MKFALLLVVWSCVVWDIRGYPYYPTYGNVDTYSYGDASRGGMALSRYYNPYYNPGHGGASLAAFMYRQPEQVTRQEAGQYHLPDRRRQIPQELNFNVPPQQNEIFYSQQPESPPFIPTEATELIEPTEKTAEVAPTTAKAVVPDLIEHEIEEVPEEETARKPKKAVTKRKQVKRPIDDDDEEDAYSPKMPTGAYFPMFFGWGGRSSGQPNGGGPTAIANAFSTGRGGVATSHATAYGGPRPEERV